MSLSGDKKQHILELLSYEREFRDYQDIPKFVSEILELKPKEYSSQQLAWDEPRYTWIKNHIPADIKSVVEVGSSLGYFSLRLAHEMSVEVTGFEPVKEYTKLGNLFAEISSLKDKVRFFDEEINLATISSLPEADLHISLNVLHHAGNFYDADVFSTFESWTDYAVSYLTKIRKKYRYLIFQCGNSAKGTAHFPGIEAVQSLEQILKRAGYSVNAIGVIGDLAEIKYASYSSYSEKEIPKIWCKRNEEKKLVDYFDGYNLVATLPYGTLQRPLFFCERSDDGSN